MRAARAIGPPRPDSRVSPYQLAICRDVYTLRALGFSVAQGQDPRCLGRHASAVATVPPDPRAFVWRVSGRAANILAFGLPGTGKAHTVCALGHALIRRGHSVLFVPTYRIVQELLVAKRDLESPRALRKLDKYDLIIPGDIGYVKQEAEETEVLFTLLAERYERRSVAITSNLTFKDWDQVFRNLMTSAAAIDRLVHHSVILEFAVPGYRMEHRDSRQDEAS